MKHNPVWVIKENVAKVSWVFEAGRIAFKRRKERNPEEGRFQGWLEVKSSIWSESLDHYATRTVSTLPITTVTPPKLLLFAVWDTRPFKQSHLIFTSNSFKIGATISADVKWSLKGQMTHKATVQTQISDTKSPVLFTSSLHHRVIYHHAWVTSNPQ